MDNTKEKALREVFCALAEGPLEGLQRDIALTISEQGLNKQAFTRTLQLHAIHDPCLVRDDLLDLLLCYLERILADGVISENEFTAFGLLKILFGIKEGDFYHYRAIPLTNLVTTQLRNILADNLITREEAMHLVDIQSLFGLSIDQYEQIESVVLIRVRK